ncbi:adhesin biosynthesis transcription regulatory family protein [Vibrio porteresiae]|uniref:Adhesin biosynthesis transcription regulatory family protein n=1 Tax=Vibrio porteresiae DSM 19223 TaxID=1123496 RepID=A0ABZ0QAK9_9VIBR|nr:adhesin biosynthesis transcription regulatory family protein [Vibrio porteresiae]WPC72960.1 adhesin biosynthesis transcription regulatory family protein [Vibrio porteresiae DSM 19223]
MIQGLEKKERLELLISLTNIRSESQITALERYFVDGLNFEAAAAIAEIPSSNFKRVLDRVQEIDAVVEKIKEIDWCKFKSENR